MRNSGVNARVRTTARGRHCYSRLKFRASARQSAVESALETLSIPTVHGRGEIRETLNFNAFGSVSTASGRRPLFKSSSMRLEWRQRTFCDTESTAFGRWREALFVCCFTTCVCSRHRPRIHYTRTKPISTAH